MIETCLAMDDQLNWFQLFAILYFKRKAKTNKTCSHYGYMHFLFTDTVIPYLWYPKYTHKAIYRM